MVDLAKRQPVDVFAGAARKRERDRSGDDGVSRLEQQLQERCARAWGTSPSYQPTLINSYQTPTGPENPSSTRTGTTQTAKHQPHPNLDNSRKQRQGGGGGGNPTGNKPTPTFATQSRFCRLQLVVGIRLLLDGAVDARLRRRRWLLSWPGLGFARRAA